MIQASRPSTPTVLSCSRCRKHSVLQGLERQYGRLLEWPYAPDSAVSRRRTKEHTYSPREPSCPETPCHPWGQEPSRSIAHHVRGDLIGLQAHIGTAQMGGSPMIVRFRDLNLAEWPVTCSKIRIKISPALAIAAASGAIEASAWTLEAYHSSCSQERSTFCSDRSPEGVPLLVSRALQRVCSRSPGGGMIIQPLDDTLSGPRRRAAGLGPE